MMTERSFLKILKALLTCPDEGRKMSKVLDLAKKAGATFKREPIELPMLTRLKPIGSPIVGYAVYPAISGRHFTAEEADEVIRRCNLIPKLKDYINKSHRDYREYALDILDMLDGNEE